jgi:hypothetical protein
MRAYIAKKTYSNKKTLICVYKIYVTSYQYSQVYWFRRTPLFNKSTYEIFTTKNVVQAPVIVLQCAGRPFHYSRSHNPRKQMDLRKRNAEFSAISRTAFSQSSLKLFQTYFH